MVLSKPENGWVDIHMGNLMLRASYTTDVAADMLSAMSIGLLMEQTISISFDSEECWYTLVMANDNSAYIITDAPYSVNNYDSLYRFKLDREEFARGVLADIETNFDAWVDWDPQLVDSKKARKKRVKKLRTYTRDLNNILKLRDYVKRSAGL